MPAKLEGPDYGNLTGSSPSTNETIRSAMGGRLK
jgi:hypothetical protein